MINLLMKFLTGSRKINFKFSLLEIKLGAEGVYWGLSLLSFQSSGKKYSFFDFTFIPPHTINPTPHIRWQGDFLFLYYPIVEFLENKRERKIWQSKK